MCSQKFRVCRLTKQEGTKRKSVRTLLFLSTVKGDVRRSGLEVKWYLLEKLGLVNLYTFRYVCKFVRRSSVIQSF